MKRSGIRKLVLASLVAVTCLVALTVMNRPAQPASGNGMLSLQAPSFIGVARAEGAAPTAVSAIVDEAGISAYFQAPVSITISSVASLFRTIEFSNTDYIIGSMAVPNYDIYHDVHVYIHKNGYVLAYYFKNDPASKIFDWKAYNGVSITTTKLKNVLAIVASAAGSSFPGATYYDFRYPNATNLMLIAEAAIYTTQTFEVTLPGSFIYYERSWSLYVTGCGGDYSLDGTQIAHGGNQNTLWGLLSASQLLPDTLHTFQLSAGYAACSANAYGVIALAYRVP